MAGELGDSGEGDVGSQDGTTAWCPGLANLLGEGVYRLDSERTIRAVNDALVELTGYSRGDLLGEHVSTLFDGTAFARCELATRRLLTGDDAETISLTVQTAAGETLPCTLRVGRAGGGEGDGVGDGVGATVGVLTRIENGDSGAQSVASADPAQWERSQQFERMVDAVEDYAIFMLDPDGRVVTWNSGAARIKGYEADEIVGEQFATFYTPEDRAAGVPETNLATAAAEGRVEDEGWRVRADGTEFWASVTITALRDDAGRLRGYTKVTRDMTERREHERRLQRERDLNERILDAAPVSITVVDDDGELLRANQHASILAGVDTEDRADVGVVDAYDVHGEYVPPAQRPSMRVFETGEPVTGDRLRIETDDGTRWLSVNAVPIHEDGEVDRVVVAAEDVTQLTEQARQLEAERDTLESELADVFERVTNAFFALDEAWQFTYVNDRAEDVLGRAEKDLLGETIWEAFPGAVDSTFQTEYERAMAEQETVSFEAYYDPLETWFAVDAYPSGSGLSVYFRDITERKERERELEQYHAFTQAVSDTIVTIDTSGTIQSVNPAVADTFGYEPAELVGESLTTLMDEAASERCHRAISQYLQTGERQFDWSYVELPAQHRDGQQVPVALSLSEFEYDGERYFTGVMRDITERKERERQLEQYHAFTQAATDTIITIDTTSTIQSVNPAVADTFGYEPAELVGEPLTTLMPSEFTDQHSRAVSQYLRTGEKHVDWSYVELPGQHRDGHRIPLAISFSEFEYESERYFTGVMRDITERKERERELERYETVIETVTDGIILLDSDGQIRDANRGFVEMTGYTKSELVDEHASLIRPDDLDPVMDDVQSALDAGADTETVETMIQPKDGAEIPTVTNFARITFDDGTAGRVGVVRDVTDQRERERQLEEAQRWNETLIENVPSGAVALVDERLRYITFGGTPEGSTDLTRADLEGKPVGEALPAELADVVVPGYEAALDGDPVEFEATVDDRIYEFHFVPVRDDDGEVFAATGMSQDITDRKEREQQLQARIRQQEVVTQLGQQALAEDDLDALFDETVALVAETLDTDYCKVLELLPDGEAVFLRSGVGWRDGLVGSATVPTDTESQAGYTLLSEEPVVVPDMDAEDRFSGPELLTSHDVSSGISVIIGSPDDPWGILGIHDTDERAFTDHDVNFVQSVATILTTAIDRVEHERQLTQQRERLAALNNVNAISRDIIRVLIQQSSREDIEQLVCDRLASSDSYAFAWIGDLDSETSEVRLRAEAGVEGYLDDVTITADDSETGRGPTGRALTTGDVQVCEDVTTDPEYDAWRDRALDYGYRSSVAVPITYEQTTYGVLNVYAERPFAFQGEELAVVEQLGDVIGHAINAIERKRLLMSDEVVEIEFRLQNLFDSLDLDGSPQGRFTIEQLIPVSDGEYLGYGTVTAEGVATLERLAAERPTWTELSLLDDGFAESRFEVRLSDPPALGIVAAYGGHIPTATFADGDFRLTAQLPPDVPVRQVVEAMQAEYPCVELLAQRRTATDRASGNGMQVDLDSVLTDRQYAALKAAYSAGFFEWPRESTGEEVADALDISAPTFHQHLRGSQKRLLQAIIDGKSPA